MSRDHRKLRVFTLADRLVVEVYRASSGFPASERYGLQGQLRKAAVSSAVNIVEGSARRTDGEYLHFLNIALASAADPLPLRPERASELPRGRRSAESRARLRTSLRRTDSIDQLFGTLRLEAQSQGSRRDCSPAGQSLESKAQSREPLIPSASICPTPRPGR